MLNNAYVPRPEYLGNRAFLVVGASSCLSPWLTGEGIDA